MPTEGGDAQELTKPMFSTSSACHMIASSFLLDSRLAVWTRLGGALNLFDTFGCVGIVIAK